MKNHRSLSSFATLSSLTTLLVVTAGCEVTDDESAGTEATAASSGQSQGIGGTGDDSATAPDTNGSTTGPATAADSSATAATDSTDAADSEDSGDSANATDSNDSGSAIAPGCRHVCEDDTDCLFQGGINAGLRCGEASYCAFTCDVDTDCAAVFATNPQQPCTANAECAVSGLCLDRGDGSGACSFIPSGIACPPELELVDVVDIAGTPAMVCGTLAVCIDNDDGTRACDIASGCEEDGCPGDLTCGQDGTCFCTADEDCGPAGDTCTDGLCSFSCDSAADCEDVPLFANFEGGSLVCEGA